MLTSRPPDRSEPTVKPVLVPVIRLCVQHNTSYAIFQASAMKQTRTALWTATQRQYIVQEAGWISENVWMDPQYLAVTAAHRFVQPHAVATPTVLSWRPLGRLEGNK
jgi:hypothetical protein